MTNPLLLISLLLCMQVPNSTSDDPEIRFTPGTRVEIDGKYDGEFLEAVKLVQEEDDEFLEIKGAVSSVNLQRSEIIVGPFTILVDEKTDFDDSEDDEESHELSEIQQNWRLEIEGQFVSPLTFKAVEIEVDTNPADRKMGLLELEGYVESQDLDEDGVPILTIHGIPCRIGSSTEIPGGVFRKVAMPMFDRDERRPKSRQTFLDGKLGIAGRLYYEFEERNNLDLDENLLADRTDREWSISLQALWSLDSDRFFFAKGRAKNSTTDEDDEAVTLSEDDRGLEELYYFQNGILGKPLSVEVGRMDFDEGREWFYDSSLDAIRLRWEEGPYSVEASWSSFIGDPPVELEDRHQHILVGTYRPESKTQHSIYLIDIIQDRKFDPNLAVQLPNESPFFVGIQSHGRALDGDLRWWADAAYVSGVTGFDKISAFGCDLKVARRFDDKWGKPYLFGGWAWGSGDDDPDDGTDHSFRQTGYQDNNSRYYGISSYRYLGVLLRPELSNMSILTLGGGVRPYENMSVDFVYHQYNQVEAADFLRRTRLRIDPNGIDRDLGSEIDLVIGLNDVFDQIDMEFEVGYFMPGSAFGSEPDDSWFSSVQFKYYF